MTNSDKEIIKEALGSHATYVGKFKPGCEDADLSWQSPLPMEARFYIRFVEAVVYTCNKDSKLKACLIGGASASDLPDSAEFKQEFDEIRKNWKSMGGAGSQSDIQQDVAMAESQEDKVAIGVAYSPQFHSLSIDADPDFTAKQQAQFASLRQTLASLTEEEQAIVKKYEIEAMRHVRASVNLLVENEQRKNMAEDLAAALQKGGSLDSKMIFMLYDQKAAGEPITAPHIRVPPLRAERLKRAVTVTLDALSTEVLPQNLVIGVSDAGTLGNKTVTRLFVYTLVTVSFFIRQSFDWGQPFL